MNVCEFQAHCARVPVVALPVSNAGALYRIDSLYQQPVVSDRTLHMMLVSSLVGACIWMAILHLIFV